MPRIAYVALAGMILSACPADPIPLRTSDAGETTTCGAVRQTCCTGAQRCLSGGICDSSGTCCTTVTFRCQNSEECCGALECESSRCCAPPGGVCRDAESCCTGTCVNGTCSRDLSACGGVDQACCTDDMCNADLVCSAGFCRASDPNCTHSDCQSCLNDPSGRCGFCASSGTCALGTPDGPDGSSCVSGWQFGASGMCVDECRAFDDACSGCLGASCAYCATSDQCVSAGSDAAAACADIRTTASECTGVCTEVRGDCSIDGECCDGFFCRAGVTFPQRCCGGPGTVCASGGDCCGQMGCSGTCICRPVGQTCLSDVDCCAGGICEGGRCQTGSR